MPLSNARYALNAANARWGSLYDALYGTDVIPDEGDAARGKGFNPARGAARGRRAPRRSSTPPCRSPEGSHRDVDRACRSRTARWCSTSADGDGVASPSRPAFAGYRGAPAAPDAVLLRHNGLGIELVFDRASPVGSTDPAGLADVVLEAAVSTIMDMEDSVAAVDAEDKVAIYRNWLGLDRRATLTADFPKGGRTVERHLNPDLELHGARTASPLTLHGRSLMLVRNVGHHMYTDAVLDGRRAGAGRLPRRRRQRADRQARSRRAPATCATAAPGSIYIVKPKMHGPDEVAFTNELFGRVEDLLGLPRNTRQDRHHGRGAAHLGQPRGRHPGGRASGWCSSTPGFLDRTGDEIHTSMEAGPMVRKNDMKNTGWIKAYEDNNVDAGLAMGLPGRRRSARACGRRPTAWPTCWPRRSAIRAPAPTRPGCPRRRPRPCTPCTTTRSTCAARQKELATRAPARIEDLLTIPVSRSNWAPEAVQEELDNNIQGILGYVVRWIDQGVGCSKVPDIHDVGPDGGPRHLADLEPACRQLARCTASSREAQVEETLQRMAASSTARTPDDPLYRPMAPAFDGEAFAAARDLVFKGRQQPNGYTEWILHARRRAAKAKGAVTAG